MKFQYISDLHLEFHDTNIITLQPVADYLLLAGDIGNPTHNNYIEFLDDVSKKYKDVFIIAGNHEYYHQQLAMEQTEQIIRDICSKYSNVHFLQNEFYDFPATNVSIFGSTLWTHINPHESYVIQSTLGDYENIPGFTTTTCTALHFKAIESYKTLVNKRKDRQIIVLVHHLPHTDLIDSRYFDSCVNSAYASDVECFKVNNVKAVVYGHTHIKNVSGKYFCNPVGHKEENKTIDLEASFHIACESK